MIGSLVGLSVVGAISWYLVFNEQARRKFAEPFWTFWKRSEPGREVDDAFILARALIVAVFCSTLLVAMLIVAAVQWLK